MDIKGDVQINGKWYRIDIPSYKVRDVIDFSPRAASPGGGIVLSDLMLYQPLMQTDWRHGFGFIRYDDTKGYLRTEGNIDTRHEGIVTMYTNPVSSDVEAYKKIGGVVHDKIPFFWGPDGVRKYSGGVWETVTASSTSDTNLMFSLGDYLFACPKSARIRKSQYSGEVQEQPAESTCVDTYLNENAPTTNYGTKAELKVGTLATSKHSAIYLKIPITKLPIGATVTEAKLTLMCTARTTDVPSLKVARCLRNDVSETQATWNLYKTGNSWTTAGAKGSGTDIAAATLFSGAMTSEARQFYTMNLDLTEFNSLVANNYGMVIWEEYDGSELRNATFSSSSDANSDWRPYLSIKYTNATEWSDAGTDTNSIDYHWQVIYNGYSYLGERGTNRVHYSSSTTLADLEGGSGDTGAIVVGGGSYPTLRAINYLGAIYIARADGLWQLADDKIARRVLDFSSEVDEDNFNSMVIYNGYIMFTVRDVVYQWNGSRLTRVTPNRISDDWPYRTYGSFANLTNIGDYLYCTARTNDSTYTESLLCYDGVGWHKLCDLITDGLGKITMLFFDVSNNYLWIHKDASTPITYYIPFQSMSDYPYSSFPTTGSHCLYSCVHDMGFSRITKSSPSILIEADNLSTQTYLEVYYSLDSGDWYLWGKAKDDGTTELTMPGGIHTIEYKTIQFLIKFVTTVSTVTPILKGVTLRFLMRPDVALGWNFNVIVADHFVYGDHEDERTAAVLLSDLRTARDSKSPIKFVDLQEREYYAYVSSFSESAQERNIDTENAGVPSIESVINVNIVEAK